MKLPSQTLSLVNRCSARNFHAVFVQFVVARHHPSFDVSSVGRSFDVDSPPQDDRLELDAFDRHLARTNHVVLVGMFRVLPSCVHGRTQSSTCSVRFLVPFLRRTCRLAHPPLGLDTPRLTRAEPPFLLSL